MIGLDKDAVVGWRRRWIASLFFDIGPCLYVIKHTRVVGAETLAVRELRTLAGVEVLSCAPD